MKNSDKLSFSDTIKILLKSLMLSIRLKGFLSVIISVLGFAAAFLPVLIADSFSKFTDKIQDLYRLRESVETADNSILYIFVVLIALYFVQVIYNFMQTYVTGIDSLKTNRYISEQMLRITCQVDYKYLDNYDDFKDKLDFIEAYAGKQVGNSMQQILLGIQYFISFVGIFIRLYSVNALIPVIIVLTSIPSVVLAYLHNDELYRFQNKNIQEARMSRRYFFMSSGQEALQEVKQFGIFNYLKDRWRYFSDILVNTKKKISKKHTIANIIADMLKNLTYIIVIAFACYDIFYGNGTLGLFTLIFTLTGQIQEIAKKLFLAFAQTLTDIKYMKDYFDIYEIGERYSRINAETLNTNCKYSMPAGIEYKNVSFSYPGSNVTVLNNINVHIKQGEKVAIVGENGSGKSTFVNLLCGFYKPSQGSIFVNGKDLHQDNAQLSRHSFVSAIFQEFGQYDSTLRYNISLKNPDDDSEDDEIMKLAKKIGTDKVILEKKEGLNSEIGVFNEVENNFSGGQWQQVAITRAAFRDRPILILDEPTSALDPISELNLYANITTMTDNKTMLLISHRLGISKYVDRILVFKDGKIIEDGTHDELIAANKFYAKMYTSQASWYQNEKLHHPA